MRLLKVNAKAAPILALVLVAILSSPLVGQYARQPSYAQNPTIQKPQTAQAMLDSLNQPGQTRQLPGTNTPRFIKTSQAYPSPSPASQSGPRVGRVYRQDDAFNQLPPLPNTQLNGANDVPLGQNGAQTPLTPNGDSRALEPRVPEQETAPRLFEEPNKEDSTSREPFYDRPEKEPADEEEEEKKKEEKEEEDSAKASEDDERFKELEKKIEELEEMNSEENQPAFSADYDKGFRITPRDKKKTPFELKINGRLQFRWTGFSRDTNTFTNRLGTTTVASRNDFEVERGRLEFKGFAIDPRIKYYFNLDADTDDNHGVIFHDFWFDYEFSKSAIVRIGKAKVPGSYEWLESSTTTRFSDRSLSTTYFRADRSVGAWLLGKTEQNFYYQLAITNGFTTTDLSPSNVDDNFAYTGLFYIDPWGDAGSGYSDLMYHVDPVVRMGSSFSYANMNPNASGAPTAEQDFARVSDGARVTDPGGVAPGVTINDFDHYLLSAFITGKWRGFSFNAEYYARWLENFGTVSGAAPGVNDLFDSGFYVDAGYFLVPGRFEVNGRLSQIDGLFGDTWEYAAGCNWFHNQSHKSKVTFDATVLEGSPTSSSSPNFSIGQDGVLYRLQYQIAF